MKSKIVVSAYFIAGLINLFTQLLHKPDITDLSKAALMPLLLYYLFEEARGVITLPRLLLAIGLIFSWARDLLLINDQVPAYFLSGLGMFLIAQILYSTVMLRACYQKPTFSIKKIFPVALYGAVLLYMILPKAKDMSVPVIFYSLCILAMATMAIHRKGSTTENSYKFTLAGAIFFAISDSLIALSKFVMEIPFSGILVMSTYIIAQFLIVKGILKHPTS